MNNYYLVLVIYLLHLYCQEKSHDLLKRVSTFVKVLLIYTEAGLDYNGYSFSQYRLLGWKSKSCFSVGIWKSGHEGQQPNKQKQQFSDIPPSRAAPLQVSKHELLLNATRFSGL